MLNISVQPERIFNLFGLPVTNTLLTTWIAMIILLAFAYAATRKKRDVPRGAQNIFEFLLEGASSGMTLMTGDKKKTEKFLPLVLTIFLFILFANWLGILPGVGTVGFNAGSKEFVPLLRSAATDLNLTLALAAITMLAVHVFGVWTLGAWQHFKKYVSANPIYLFVGALEALGEISKTIAFTFRLFGNIFAGEVLLAVFAFLAPFLAPLPFLMLELFVGFIQAVVFAVLALMFLAMATDPHAEFEH